MTEGRGFNAGEMDRQMTRETKGVLVTGQLPPVGSKDHELTMLPRYVAEISSGNTRSKNGEITQVDLL